MMIPHPTLLIPVQLYFTYIYILVSRLRRHDALKLLDSKYTLVIGGCGAEGEAVCPAPTFEREI